MRKAIASKQRLVASPDIIVASVNPPNEKTMTWRVPKRVASQPDIGVTIAVARMLNVITHEISSVVAENDPRIWGRMVATTRIVVPYSVVARITENRIRYRRNGES